MKRKAGIILVVIVVIADRILKLWFKNLPPGEVFSFVPGLNFGYSLNPALFFFPAWSWIPWVALVVLIVLTTYYLLSTTYSNHFLPILLGGFSNVFDRFFYSGVIDYVEIFGLANANLADILILVGLFGLIFKTKSSRSS